MGPDNEDRTPEPYYEAQTGYLCLSNGKHRQVVLRFKWPFFYLLWKGKPKKEVSVRIDELFKLVIDR